MTIRRLSETQVLTRRFHVQPKENAEGNQFVS